jgi:hypothetical protein
MAKVTPDFASLHPGYVAAAPKCKKPRGTGRGAFGSVASVIVMRRHPFFAGLAATYSSKS